MSDAAQDHGEDCPVCENRRELKRLAEGMEPYKPSAATAPSRCDTSTALASRRAVEVIETREQQEYEVVKSGVGWPEPKVIWRGTDRFYAARLAETAQRAYTHLTVWVRNAED